MRYRIVVDTKTVGHVNMTVHESELMQRLAQLRALPAVTIREVVMLEDE